MSSAVRPIRRMDGNIRYRYVEDLQVSCLFCADDAPTHHHSCQDEYMIPMGEYNSMRDVVDDARESGTQILTFKSTRAVPIHSFME
jgi:hypothetical protein